MSEGELVAQLSSNCAVLALGTPCEGRLLQTIKAQLETGLMNPEGRVHQHQQAMDLPILVCSSMLCFCRSSTLTFHLGRTQQ